MKNFIKQKLKERLFESKNIGLLYHFTNYRGLIGIISDDFKLKSNIQDYVSFTRNKNFKSYTIPIQVRITIDGNTLTNRYRLQSYADVKAGYGRGKEDEAEERVSLLKYPIGIDIKKSLIKIEIIIPQNVPEYDDEIGEPPSLLDFEMLKDTINKNQDIISENQIIIEVVKKF